MAVARETDHCSAKSRPDGIAVPGGNSPLAICARRDSAISSYLSTAMIPLRPWWTGPPVQNTSGMSTYELAPEVRTFYESVIDEGARLRTSADGRLELLRTREILRRYLPDAPARVLDVGGGTGVHAEWLVEDGYDVDLVDPVVRHVEQAAKVCRADVGDARALAAASDSYDVVQLLGPLYHLPDPADRAAALAEAVRVARPGGVVAAAAINRYASLFEHVTYAHLHTERLHTSVSSILQTAVYDGKRGFTLAFFHRAEELAAS